MELFEKGDANVPAIVCLDDSGEVWSRLRMLLEEESISSEFILTRVSRTATDLLTICRRLVPALLIVAEEQLPEVPVAGLREKIRPIGVQLLVFSDRTDPASLESFFRQGCSGVLPRAVPGQMLLKAIRTVFSGELWFPRRLISHLARETILRGPPPRLTRRQADILRLISLGHTNQQIADQCFISRETVRWHIRSLYEKIGVEDREGAKREAKLIHGVGSPAAGRPEKEPED